MKEWISVDAIEEMININLNFVSNKNGLHGDDFVEVVAKQIHEMIYGVQPLPEPPKEED